MQHGFVFLRSGDENLRETGYQRATELRGRIGQQRKAGHAIVQGASRVPQILRIPLEFPNYFFCDKTVLGSGGAPR
jgi:hypothetical protein